MFVHNKVKNVLKNILSTVGQINLTYIIVLSKQTRHKFLVKAKFNFLILGANSYI